MKSPPSFARTYRRVGYLALGHALALIALTALLLSMQSDEPEFWFRRLWVGLVTLWFFWPIILLFHLGRSALRLGVFASLGVLLLLPSLHFYNMLAPETFGVPWVFSMSPVSVWKYYSAYLAGRSEAKKDLSAGILAIADASLVPGHERWDGRILRERFQIEIKTIAGSGVDEKSLGHQTGYNSISFLEIDRRIGWERVQTARDEALQAQYEREEQSVRELTKRLSSLPPDAKVTTELIRPYIDNFPLKDPAVEQRLAPFVHAVEQSVMGAVPEDMPAFELDISATLAPNSRPSFQISRSPNLPPSVSQAISKSLDTMRSPEWTNGSLSVAFNFRVRPPR